MNNNLAIIGASYLQLPLIKKAKEMGYITHVFAWKANDIGEKEADYFYPISIVEKDKILKKCEEIGICGICSIASDVAVITVNYIAEKMKLSGNSVRSSIKCTNKYQMRMTFEKEGDPSPKCILVDETTNLDLIKLQFPVIVKPTDRSGSRGIYKLYSGVGLKDAIKNAINLGFEKKALIEEYVSGQEYSVEYISYNGEHHFLALTKKYTTGEPSFIETGHLEPAPISEEMLNRIQEIVTHALSSLDIKNGASHSEIKIDTNNEIKIIEIGARMGGDCIGSELVKYSTGYDYVKMVIEVACGNLPDFTKVCTPIKVESKFIFTEEDLKEYQKDLDGGKIIKTMDFHPENIGHITDSSNRAGCYIRRVE